MRLRRQFDADLESSIALDACLAHEGSRVRLEGIGGIVGLDPG